MTSEEMQRAIEFVLKTQAGFEVQFEKTNRQIEQLGHRVEQLSGQVGQIGRRTDETAQQLVQTNRQLEQTNLLVSSLADTQASFMQAMTRHVEAQGKFNASMRRSMKEMNAELSNRLIELAEAQQRTNQDVSELARAVDKLIKRNGDEPPA